MNKLMIFSLVVIFGIQACAQTPKKNPMKDYKGDKVIKTEDEWRSELTPEEYRVLRQKGTERAFTGDLYQHKEDGTYICAACAAPLFDSETKYESGSGWPSFYEPINETIVGEIMDASHGMIRTEVVCNRCGGHLGHVFNDGPNPTGLRYCINSVSLDFKAKSDEEEE